MDVAIDKTHRFRVPDLPKVQAEEIMTKEQLQELTKR